MLVGARGQGLHRGGHDVGSLIREILLAGGGGHDLHARLGEPDGLVPGVVVVQGADRTRHHGEAGEVGDATALGGMGVVIENGGVVQNPVEQGQVHVVDVLVGLAQAAEGDDGVGISIVHAQGGGLIPRRELLCRLQGEAVVTLVPQLPGIHHVLVVGRHGLGGVVDILLGGEEAACHAVGLQGIGGPGGSGAEHHQILQPRLVDGAVDRLGGGEIVLPLDGLVGAPVGAVTHPGHTRHAGGGGDGVDLLGILDQIVGRVVHGKGGIIGGLLVKALQNGVAAALVTDRQNEVARGVVLDRPLQSHLSVLTDLGTALVQGAAEIIGHGIAHRPRLGGDRGLQAQGIAAVEHVDGCGGHKRLFVLSLGGHGVGDGASRRGLASLRVGQLEVVHEEGQTVPGVLAVHVINDEGDCVLPLLQGHRAEIHDLEQVGVEGGGEMLQDGVALGGCHGAAAVDVHEKVAGILLFQIAGQHHQTVRSRLGSGHLVGEGIGVIPPLRRVLTGGMDDAPATEFLGQNVGVGHGGLLELLGFSVDLDPLGGLMGKALLLLEVGEEIGGGRERQLTRLEHGQVNFRLIDGRLSLLGGSGHRGGSRGSLGGRFGGGFGHSAAAGRQGGGQQKPRHHHTKYTPITLHGRNLRMVYNYLHYTIKTHKSQSQRKKEPIRRTDCSPDRSASVIWMVTYSSESRVGTPPVRAQGIRSMASSSAKPTSSSVFSMRRVWVPFSRVRWISA